MPDLDEREDSFDALLRAAAFRLRNDVARAAVPPLRRRTQSHRRRWIIAAVATVAVVAGLVAIGTNRNDQSLGNDPSRLHWLITDVPSDLPLVAMFDPTTQSGGVDPTVMFNLYATGAAPLGPVLRVTGSMGMPDLDLVPAQGGTNFREVTIDGRRAAFADGQSGQRLLYIETGGHWIYLTSRNIDDATLEVLAAAAVRTDDGNASIPANGLVAGLMLVVGADTHYSELFGRGKSASADYAAPDGRSVGLLVASSRRASRALAGLEAALTPMKVAGVNGFIGAYTFPMSVPALEVTVVRWERDGLAFTVQGNNVAREVVVNAANSVVAASDAKWAELLKATGYDAGSGAAPAGTSPADPAPADTTPPFTGQPVDVAIDVSVSNPSANEQVWSGTLPTGETWKVFYTHVYDTFSMRSEINGVPSGGTSSGPAARPAGQEISCCPANVVTTDPKAVALRVLRSNGDRYTIPLHDLPGIGNLPSPGTIRAAFIELPDGMQQAELLDADGNVLQSLPPG